VNNQDDRTRGEGNNPFGNFNDRLGAKETGKGPFAGDAVSFTLYVYKDAALKRRIGAALFTCQYDFAKTAFCDAAFRLIGGVLYTAGEVDFNAARFSLPVVGGDGAYSDAKGHLDVSPGAHHAQRLSFQLA
jgi:hypothetical protein